MKEWYNMSLVGSPYETEKNIRTGYWRHREIGFPAMPSLISGDVDRVVADWTPGKPPDWPT